jgi:hypothetical protein
VRQLRGRQNVQQNGPRGRQNIRPMNNTSWKIMAINLKYIIVSYSHIFLKFILILISMVYTRLYIGFFQMFSLLYGNQSRGG